ncbi:MAG TPA: hypothetical protein VGC69_19540 [Bordetella sp.]
MTIPKDPACARPAMQDRQTGRPTHPARGAASLMRACALAVALGAALAGCGGDNGNAPSSASQPSTAQTAGTGTGAGHTLLIELDGATYSAVQTGIANGSLPNLATLQIQVAYSGGVSGALTQQANLATPGWATLLTGTWANRHMVSSDAAGQVLRASSLFDRIKTANAGLNGVAVASPGLAALLAPQKSTGSLDALDDCSTSSTADDCVTSQAAALIDGSYAAVVAQYHSAADAAFNFGLGSPQYAATLKQLDTNVGALLAETAKSSGRWLVALTAGYGLNAAGNADGLPLLAESTTFIGLNQAGNDPAGVAAVPSTLNNLYSYASIADITPTLLAWLHAMPDAASYAMDGGELIGDLPAANINVAFNTATTSAALTWQAPPSGDIAVLRNGQQLATLPAGTTTYTDTGLGQYLATAGNQQLNYTVQAGAGTALRATLTPETAFIPLATTLSNGLLAYYPFSNSLPPQDKLGNTTLGPTRADQPATTGTPVAGPFDSGYGLLIDENQRDAGNYEAYMLTFNSASQDITNTAAPSYTVGFWFKVPQNMCITRGDYPLFSNKNFASGANPGVAIAIYNNGASGIGCTIHFNMGDGSHRVDPAASFSNQQWVYVAEAFDGPNNALYTYVWDPVFGLRSATTSTSALTPLSRLYNAPGGPITVTSGATTYSGAYMGWGLATDGSGQYYTEQLTAGNKPLDTTYQTAFADLAIWNRVLTANEVQSLYQSRQALSTLVGN